MKKAFIFAGMLAALASCSTDEIVSVNTSGDEISYSTAVNSASRAAGVYCNNDKFNNFTVWAWTAPTDGTTSKLYIGGDRITTQDKGFTWKNSVGTRYWPSDALDFYAFTGTNDDATVSLTSDSKTITFSVNTDVKNQTDFCYAVMTGQKKTETNSTVNLNFRHALAQVVFQAQCTNPNLKVVIDGVQVCNVYTSGDFTFPSVSTSTQYGEHQNDGYTAIPNIDQSWGTWSNCMSNYQSTEDGQHGFTVNFNKVTMYGNSATYSLTDWFEEDAVDPYMTQLAGNYTSSSANALLMLPTVNNVLPGKETEDNYTSKDGLSKWNPDQDASPYDEDNIGTYFLVKCAIWNVAGDEETLLWGDENNDSSDEDNTETKVETKWVAIPVEIVWNQGYKYIYTFVFGNGNGGYDPAPENPDDPKPVLVPISFNVTVDDFVFASNSEVEMKTNDGDTGVTDSGNNGGEQS